MGDGGRASEVSRDRPAVHPVLLPARLDKVPASVLRAIAAGLHAARAAGPVLSPSVPVRQTS